MWPGLSKLCLHDIEKVMSELHFRSTHLHDMRKYFPPSFFNECWFFSQSHHGVSKELPQDRWRKTCKAVHLPIEPEISNPYRLHLEGARGFACLPQEKVVATYEFFYLCSCEGPAGVEEGYN